MSNVQEKKKFVNLATKIIHSKNSDSQHGQFVELEKLAVNMVTRLGFNVNDLVTFRKVKNKRNGGFDKKYILSEKVLPVNQGTVNSKILRDDLRDIKSNAHETNFKMDLYGIRPIPEKLIRDKVPMIIEKQAKANGLMNYKAKVRQASNSETIKFIIQKLREECIEFLAAVDPDDQLDDLIDVLDVIDVYKKHINNNLSS